MQEMVSLGLAGCIHETRRGCPAAPAWVVPHLTTPPAAAISPPMGPTIRLRAHPPMVLPTAPLPLRQLPCGLPAAGRGPPLLAAPPQCTAVSTVILPGMAMTSTMAGPPGSHPGMIMSHAPDGPNPCPEQALCPAWPAPAGHPRAAHASIITTSTLADTASKYSLIPWAISMRRLQAKHHQHYARITSGSPHGVAQLFWPTWSFQRYHCWHHYHHRKHFIAYCSCRGCMPGQPRMIVGVTGSLSKPGWLWKDVEVHEGDAASDRL